MGKHNINKVTAAGLLIALGIIYGDIGTSPLYVFSAIINGKPIENAAVDNLRQGSIKDNMGALSIRYEPDNGSLFIDKGRLERWCADERINQTSMTEGLYALGAVRSRSFVKNLAQGTMSVSAPVRTLWLDTKIMDSLGISLTPEDSIA